MTEADRKPKTPFVPSPERKRKLAALAQLHDQWVYRNLASAPFNPDGRNPGSDYNQHYADVEDNRSFDREARRIFDA